MQLRLPEELVKEIDKLVETGKFKNRSDAIRIIVTLYNEREKTREFLKMLDTRSLEAEKTPEILIRLEDSG